MIAVLLDKLNLTPRGYVILGVLIVGVTSRPN